MRVIHVSDGSGYETNDRYYKTHIKDDVQAIRGVLRIEGWEEEALVDMTIDGENPYFINGDGEVVEFIDVNSLQSVL